MYLTLLFYKIWQYAKDFVYNCGKFYTNHLPWIKDFHVTKKNRGSFLDAT
jgi:hypothetical protein